MIMISSCFFGFALLGSMVYTMMKDKDSKIFKNFMNTLNEEQKKVYMEIKKERLRLYLQGLALGCVLAIISLFLTAKKSPLTRVCVFTIFGLGVAHVYYSFMPKSKWMLDYIENKEQARNCDALWDMENGRTLCISCHRKTDTYGGNSK